MVKTLLTELSRMVGSSEVALSPRTLTYLHHYIYRCTSQFFVYYFITTLSLQGSHPICT